MFIVDPILPEEEIDRLNGEVEALVTSGGGQVESIEKMGRRKLAYEVDRRTEGFYMLFTVSANGEIVREVERRFRVLDSVLKYLTVRVDLAEKRLDKLRQTRLRKSPGGEDAPDSASAGADADADGEAVVQAGDQASG
jgi:small subunit ribosomal protein S6